MVYPPRRCCISDGVATKHIVQVDCVSNKVLCKWWCIHQGSIVQVDGVSTKEVLYKWWFIHQGSTSDGVSTKQVLYRSIVYPSRCYSVSDGVSIKEVLAMV